MYSKELSMKLCRLDDTGLPKLGQALTTNDALEVLDVRNNHFTDNGPAPFDLLPQMKGLRNGVYGLVIMRYCPPLLNRLAWHWLTVSEKNRSFIQDICEQCWYKR
jgi:hypothetical protein